MTALAFNARGLGTQSRGFVSKPRLLEHRRKNQNKNENFKLTFLDYSRLN